MKSVFSAINVIMNLYMMYPILVCITFRAKLMIIKTSYRKRELKISKFVFLKYPKFSLYNKFKVFLR